jgi:hypothetical protein
MPRSVKEWIGASDNSKVPPRVRERILSNSREECEACTRVIQPGEKWICDHIIALINGGENRESNLQPICDWCDKNVKTPMDVKEKAKVARTRKKHLGIKKHGRTIAGRKFDGTPIPSRSRS